MKTLPDSVNPIFVFANGEKSEGSVLFANLAAGALIIVTSSNASFPREKSVLYAAGVLTVNSLNPSRPQAGHIVDGSFFS